MMLLILVYLKWQQKINRSYTKSSASQSDDSVYENISELDEAESAIHSENQQAKKNISFSISNWFTGCQHLMVLMTNCCRSSTIAEKSDLSLRSRELPHVLKSNNHTINNTGIFLDSLLSQNTPNSSSENTNSHYSGLSDQIMVTSENGSSSYDNVSNQTNKQHRSVNHHAKDSVLKLIQAGEIIPAENLDFVDSSQIEHRLKEIQMTRKYTQELDMDITPCNIKGKLNTLEVEAINCQSAGSNHSACDINVRQAVPRRLLQTFQMNQNLSKDQMSIFDMGAITANNLNYSTRLESINVKLVLVSTKSLKDSLKHID